MDSSDSKAGGGDSGAGGGDSGAGGANVARTQTNAIDGLDALIHDSTIFN
jgi:hypothetical protein